LGEGWRNSSFLKSKAELSVDRWFGFFDGGKEEEMKKLLVDLMKQYRNLIFIGENERKSETN